MAGRVPIRERGPGWSYRADPLPATVYREHQAGIATPPMDELAIAAFDVGDLQPTLREWTRIAEEIMRAGQGTVTIGLGARPIPREQRPLGLAALPAFANDALDPALCGGDACVLARPEHIPRFGTPRWVQHGRNEDTLGFRDGTLIPRRGRDLDRHVWVTKSERTWMLGGTFLVVRRIVIADSFHRLATGERERVIGREHGSGVPLGGRTLYEKPDLTRLAEDAHIRVASPRNNQGIQILRRGYATDDGLLFLAYMRDPRRQFVPLQRRLAEHDALTRYTQHTGSAVFAIPPGARPRSYLGAPLFGD